MRNVRRVHLTDIWSWYRVELCVGDHLGRSEELVSRCVECDLAEPESLASLGGSAPGVVDGILSEEEGYWQQEEGTCFETYRCRSPCQARHLGAKRWFVVRKAVATHHCR